MRISGDKSIISLHCVAQIEKSKRVPELGGRELTHLSPDVLTAYIMADPLKVLHLVASKNFKSKSLARAHWTSISA